MLVAGIVIVFAACSLITSLDGLSGGSVDASEDVVDSAIGDAGSDASSATDSQAPVDGGLALLSCSANGLIAYWSMSEGSGTTVHDCVDDFDGTFSDSNVTWGTRDGGGSDLEFNSTAYVSLGMVPQLQPTGAFTVAGWYRSDMQPTNYTSLFWNYDGNNLLGFEITLAPDNSLYANIGFGNAMTEAQFPTPVSGTWMHLAIVYEPGIRLESYFNGQSFDKATTLSTDGGALPQVGVSPDDHEIRFGADDPDSTWRGGIDDIRVFTRALTPAEIQILANN